MWLTEEPRVVLTETKETNWPSGDYITVASLDISKADLERIVGRPCLHGVEEGLGAWQAIGGTLPSGALIELVIYPDSPVPAQFMFRIDSAATPSLVLSEAMRELGIDASKLTWMGDHFDI